jgi:hypothetical protein
MRGPLLLRSSRCMVGHTSSALAKAPKLKPLLLRSSRCLVGQQQQFSLGARGVAKLVLRVRKDARVYARMKACSCVGWVAARAACQAIAGLGAVCKHFRGRGSAPTEYASCFRGSACIPQGCSPQSMQAASEAVLAYHRAALHRVCKLLQRQCLHTTGLLSTEYASCFRGGTASEAATPAVAKLLLRQHTSAYVSIRQHTPSVAKRLLLTESMQGTSLRTYAGVC